jgi:cobaltochelatase CobN
VQTARNLRARRFRHAAYLANQTGYAPGVPRIALLSTSDTDLLAARGSGADYLFANPARSAHAELGAALEACDLIVARVLGSPQLLCSGFDRFRATGKPMVVLGGEQAPDAALMELSTVPMGVAADAHGYLAHGGPGNLGQLHAFLSDTVLLTGVGFEAPVEQPLWGLLPRELPPGASRPRIGILFYRAQYTAGNTAYVEALADAVDAVGGVGVPISPPRCAMLLRTCSRISAAATR